MMFVIIAGGFDMSVGSMVALTGILAAMLGEGYLVDVALIYALLGFLAVVVLCKVYMGVALEEREKKEKEARSDA